MEKTEDFNDLIGNEILTIKQQYRIIIEKIETGGKLKNFEKITRKLATAYLYSINKRADLKFLNKKNRRLEFYNHLNQFNF